MTELSTESRTVWHPTLPETDPDRYRNICSTAEERERFGLYYDRYGQLRERRGIESDGHEWGAEVSRCCFGERSCGRMWTDPREAHCAGCHQHFGGDDGFERHLDVNGGACKDPAQIGRLMLVHRKFGPTWVKRLNTQF